MEEYNKMEIKKNIFFGLLLLVGLIGCSFGAGMDLKVDTLRESSNYGVLQPRVAPDNCRYYTEENAPDPSSYIVMAEYVIKETQTVVVSRSAKTMICYAYEKAVKKGADALIVDDISKERVPGVARNTSVVKVRAIRFKGDIPPEMK